MALTKVTGQVINSTTDLSVGVATVGGGTSTGDLYVVGVTTFAGKVSIAGTLTYEDVTNVDSVGLITARSGISVTGVGVTIALGGLNVNAGISTFNDDVKVGSGITLSPDGDSYFTGIITATSGIHLEDYVFHKGDINTSIGFPSDDTLFVKTSGVERFRIDSSGDINLGAAGANTAIQASGPFSGATPKLEVKLGGASNSYTRLINIANPGGQTGSESLGRVGIKLSLGSEGSSGETNKAGIIYAESTSTYNNATSLCLATNGTERFRVDSTGRVIIGNSGTAYSSGSFQSFIAHTSNAGSPGLYSIDTTSVAAGVGGEIAFAGKYNTGAQDYAYLGHIRGIKENATAGNTACALTFSTRATGATPSEQLRITSTGEVNIGNGAGYAIWNLTGNDQRPRLQLQQTGGDYRGVAFLEERGDANGMDVFISKSRGGSGAGVITSGDTLGFLKWSGADGTRQHNAAAIGVWNDGTVATGRVAGNMSLYTSPDAVGSLTERLRIDSAGNIEVRRGGISAIPMFQLYGSGNASDAVADNLRFHNWGDANGDYWQLGSNLGLDANGNNTKPSNTLKGAAVMVDGRGGRFFVKTSPASTSTVYEGLVVDDNGRVTKPNTPIFRAYGSGGATQYNGTVMALSLTNINRGSHYDTSTNVGRFTAPVTGVYLFFTGFFPNAADSVRVELRVNGSAVTNPYINGYNSNMGAGTPSVSGGQILNLSASDYVEVAVNGNMTNTYNGHTGFSGVLLG